MKSLKAINIVKKYRQVTALNNVNLEFKPGVITTIFGLAGSGKTTLLKIIAELEKPSQGRIMLGDEDLTEQPPHLRNVAFVFQTYALFLHMTVYDNIAFPLKTKKYPKDEISRRVKEVVEILKIPQEILYKNAYRADPSLRQKIAVARAIVREANVLLLDEPLTNLEPLVRVELKSKLKEIVSKAKLTTLYVSHNQSEVLTPAERIAVMNEGQIVQYDENFNTLRIP